MDNLGSQSQRGTENIRAIMEFAKGCPELDPQGHWASHLRDIPREVMDRCPGLWRCDVALAKILVTIDASDVELHRRWVDLVDRVVSHRQSGIKNRKISTRTYAEVSRTIAEILQCALRMATAGVDLDMYRMDFNSYSLSALELLVAQLVAFYNRWPVNRQSVKNPEPLTVFDRYVKHFNSFVRAGAFPLISIKDSMSHERLVAHMGQLDLEHPEWFAAHPPERPVRNQCRIEERHEVALRNACLTAKETFIVRLLSCFAPRKGAICSIRISDVWDSNRKEPLTVLALLEKNSKVRRVPLDDKFRELISQYINNEHPGGSSPWLFPNARRQMSYDSHVVRGTLERLCRRAKIPIFNPHKFRSYIVMKGMRRKRSFAEMSKFLGHESINTTFESYFDINLEDIAAEMDDTRGEPIATPAEGLDVHRRTDDLNSECLSLWRRDQDRIRQLEKDLEQERRFREFATKRMKTDDLEWVLEQCGNIPADARSAHASDLGGMAASSRTDTTHPFD